MTDETIRLIVSYLGDDALKSMQDRLDQIAKEADNLKDEWTKGTKSLEEYIKQTGKLANEQTRLQTLMKMASSDAKEAGNQFSVSAYQLQQFGGVVDDLQYVETQGLRPILNNIMQISPMAGIALVAFDQLAKHIGDFSGKAEVASDNLEKLKKKAEDLEKKPFKMAIDFADLRVTTALIDDLQKKIDAYKATEEGDATGQYKKKAASVVTGSFEQGSAGLAKAVREADQAQGRDHVDPVLGKQMAELTRDIESARAGEAATRGTEGNQGALDRLAMLESRMRPLQEQIEQAAQKHYQDIAGGFAAGDVNSVKSVKETAKNFPQFFDEMNANGETAAQAIEGLPSSVKESSMLDAAKRRGQATADAQRKTNEAQKRQDEEAKRKKDADDKLADELNEQGQQAAEQLRADKLKQQEDARKSWNLKQKQLQEKAKKDAERAKSQAQMLINPDLQVQQGMSTIANQAFRNQGASPEVAQLAAARAVQMAMQQNISIQQAIYQTYMQIAQQQQMANARLRQMNPVMPGPWGGMN